MVRVDRAKEIIEKYSTGATYQGCRVVSLRPTKENRYVQVSFGGANKFAVLQEVVMWASASHLCHEKRCCNLRHSGIRLRATDDTQQVPLCLRGLLDCNAGMSLPEGERANTSVG
jgi:hypothetical protein